MRLDEFCIKTETFSDWLTSVGVEMSPKVKLHDYRNFEQGRGLIATADIKQGERLFTVPLKAMICVKNDADLLAIAQEHYSDYENDWAVMIACLVRFARRPEWKAYFDVLPDRFETPMFYTNEQLKLLKGSTLIEKIGKKDAEEMYEALKETMFKLPEFEGIPVTLDEFHRMGSLIMAYAFDVRPSDEPDETFKAMVPPADMLNSHTRLGNACLETLEDGSDSVAMVATKDIKEGDQVYNTYGDMPTGDLLRRYGYVEKGGTPEDIVEVTMDHILRAAATVVPGGLDQAQKRLTALQEVDPEGPFAEEFFDIDASGEPDFELLAVVEVLSCDGFDSGSPIGMVDDALVNAEEHKVSESAKKALEHIFEDMLQGYGDVSTLTLPKTDTEVYTRVEDQCTQLILREVQILRLAQDWLDGVSGQNKRQRIE